MSNFRLRCAVGIAKQVRHNLPMSPTVPAIDPALDKNSDTSARASAVASAAVASPERPLFFHLMVARSRRIQSANCSRDVEVAVNHSGRGQGIPMRCTCPDLLSTPSANSTSFRSVTGSEVNWNFWPYERIRCRDNSLVSSTFHRLQSACVSHQLPTFVNRGITCNPLIWL
jgi:hypothetical protein